MLPYPYITTEDWLGFIMVQGKVKHMIDSLGSRLRLLRQNKKLKQEQVADLIGVNKKQVSAYENNARQPSR